MYFVTKEISRANYYFFLISAVSITRELFSPLITKLKMMAELTKVSDKSLIMAPVVLVMNFICI